MHSFKVLVGASTIMLASTCLLVPSAYATSYPFTGSATVDTTTLGDAHLTGPNLNLIFLSMQSPGAHFLDCSGGAECGGQFTISGQTGASPAVAFGSLNGITAAQILGGLILASPAFLVDGAPPGPFARQEPLTVLGSLIGVDPNSNVLFSADLNATGTADFTGTASTVHGTTIVDFTKVGFTFSESVTDTPEPSSAMLLGAGLLVGGACLVRRRRICEDSDR